MLARLALGLTLVLATSCGGPGRARPGTLVAHRPAQRRGGPSCAALDPSNPTERICAVARLDTRGWMEVRLRIEPGALPRDRRDVALRFREHTFGADYAARFVEVPGRAGWPETLGPVDAPTELHYRVALDFFEQGPPRHGRAGVSWRRPGGWHLTGRSFLPDVWVDGEPAQVPATLVLDVGDEPSLTSAGPDRRQFDAPSLTRLADEAFEVGPMTVTRRDVEGTTLWMASSGAPDDGSLERAADAVARVLRLLTHRLGAPPTESVLFTLHPAAEGEAAWGERLGSSLVQVASDALWRDPLYGLTVSAHEVAHLWLPGTHVVPEGWIGEGLADYLALLVVNALVEAPRDAVARVVLRAHDDYAAGAGQRTLREPHPTDARWVYDAGIVAGYCLDARLAASGSSLFALLRATLDRGEPTLDTASLLEELGPLSPDAASYLAALVETRGAFGVEGCLERRGLEAEQVELESWSDHTLAVDVLGLRGLTALAKLQGFVVEEPAEGSSFRAGDIVLRLQDHPVATLDDVAFALRDARVGDRVTAQLRRDGEAISLEIPIDAIDDTTRRPRRYVTLEPRETP